MDIEMYRFFSNTQTKNACVSGTKFLFSRSTHTKIEEETNIGTGLFAGYVLVSGTLGGAYGIAEGVEIVDNKRMSMEEAMVVIPVKMITGAVSAPFIVVWMMMKGTYQLSQRYQRERSEK